MTDAVVLLLCGIGVVFSFTGALGILRMPDVYTRIRCGLAPSKMNLHRGNKRRLRFGYWTACVLFSCSSGSRWWSLFAAWWPR